jgi:aerobic-type carbon monoxide dehydrogenase small subunit (CoxS/CutS family)
MNLIESVRTRREAGSAHRQLRRELSAVTTPAEVNDLLALVAGSDDPRASEIRNILSENLGRCA